MFDFNNVPEFELIPTGTFAKARLILKPGNDPENHWLKISKNGGKYLDCDFVILEGQYAKRKIFHKIGIEGNEEWVKISQRFIKNLLESANAISRKDTSEKAQSIRQLEDWSDLDGLEVLIQIGVEPEGEYPPKNKIQSVVTAENPVYQQMMAIPW